MQLKPLFTFVVISKEIYATLSTDFISDEIKNNTLLLKPLEYKHFYLFVFNFKKSSLIEEYIEVEKRFSPFVTLIFPIKESIISSQFNANFLCDKTSPSISVNYTRRSLYIGTNTILNQLRDEGYLIKHLSLTNNLFKKETTNKYITEVKLLEGIKKSNISIHEHPLAIEQKQDLILSILKYGTIKGVYLIEYLYEDGTQLNHFELIYGENILNTIREFKNGEFFITIDDMNYNFIHFDENVFNKFMKSQIFGTVRISTIEHPITNEDKIIWFNEILRITGKN
jgi:phage antirepressor YoqD-like protein